MKAAVIYEKAGQPQYVEIPEPTSQHGDEVLVTVRAAAIKQLDRSRASGQHYSTNTSNTARVIGGDGICILKNGTRVYGMSIEGMLSERTLIHKDRIVPVPKNLDDATAAALPNAIIGSAMGLKFKADIQRGDIVLINGATGFTGRVAVQIAKYYGAKKVIATGRNPKGLQDLVTLGADEIIPITGDDETFKTQIKKHPPDIVIDYLWGHTAEMILGCLKGDGSFTNRIRYVSIGSMAGDIIQLSAANLRSVNLQLSGSGLGAWSKPQVASFFREIMPEMYKLAADNKLKIQTVTVRLGNIADLWDLEISDGQRLVVTIP
jgi:NADPH:quinone reductase-like Zn-dependent oxidoreductase